MVKQAKTKKGSIGKKALAALLAVSMVLSSSAFTVFASEAVLSKDVPATAEVTVKLNETPSDTYKSTYTGEQIKLDDTAVTVEVEGAAERGGDQPTVNEDFIVSWGTNINAGTDAGSVGLTFKTPSGADDYNYSALGTKTFKFDIDPKDLSALSGETLEKDVSARTFSYKGTVQRPTVSNVRIVGSSDKKVKHTLVEGQDYEIVAAEGSNMIDAKAQTIVINGINNYKTDTKTAEGVKIDYTIQKVKLTGDLVTVTSDDILWKSDLKEADIQKKVYAVDNGTHEKLIDGTDCDYEYKNTDEPDTAWDLYDPATDGTVGEHQFRIKATSSSLGNYNDGFVQGVYRIIPSSFEDAVKDVESVTVGTNKFIENGKDNPDLVYTGSDLCDGSIAVTLGGNLTQNTDFKVVTESSEEEWINAGDYEIELQGIGNYVGKTEKIPVKINPYSLSDDKGEKKANVDVTAKAGQTRNKVMTAVSLEVKDNRNTVQERELKSPKDYSYEVKSKTVNGETVNYLVITGAGNYTGSFEADITNTGKLPLSNETYISANVKKEFNWNDNVTIGSDDIEVYDVEQNIKLEYGTDYIIKAGSPADTKAGTNIVTIKAMDNSKYYEGERDVEFYVKGEAKYDTIVAIDTIEPIKKADAATMDNIRGKIKVRLIKEGGVIEEASGANDHAREKYYLRILDKDDKEVYVTGGTNSGSLSTGTYKVEVTDAEGRYEGPVTTAFTVEGEVITAPVVENVKEYTYTGEPIIPTDIKVYKDVSSKESNTPLKYGEDYDITAEDNINAGQVQATITFKGDYSGSTKVNFKINQAAGSAGLREAQKNALANGMNVGDADCVPKLVGYIGGREVNDTTLKVANMTSSNPDVAKITDEGAIKYISKGTATVTITPASENLTGLKAFDVTVKVTGGSASAGIKTPTFTPSNKISKKAKTFTVTTSTVKGATKWEVRYSLKDLTQTLTGSKYVTVKNKTKLKRYVVKCKKSKKKYYIRVRAYVKGKGWSDWSPQKSIKTR